MSRPINFTDTIVEKKPYVEINGTEYEVQDGTYNGGTDLNAETFNKMQDELDPTAIEVEDFIKINEGYTILENNIYKQSNRYFGDAIIQKSSDNFSSIPNEICSLNPPL